MLPWRLRRVRRTRADGARARGLPSNAIPERCARYAAWMLPELIRLHNNPKVLTALSAGRCVSNVRIWFSMAGKYLLQRDLVLLPALPENGRCRSRRRRQVPHDSSRSILPSALPARGSTQPHAVLAARCHRRCAVRSATLGNGSVRTATLPQTPRTCSGCTPVERSMAARVRSSPTWSRCAHRMRPVESSFTSSPLSDASSSGRWMCSTLQASRSARQSWSHERSDVIADGHELVGIRVLERAAQLSGSAARAAYHGAVVRRARLLRADAERLEASDPLGALQIVRDAKVLLHRAYWLSGRASALLGSEIDANALSIKQIVQRELNGDIHPHR